MADRPTTKKDMKKVAEWVRDNAKKFSEEAERVFESIDWKWAVHWRVPTAREIQAELLKMADQLENSPLTFAPYPAAAISGGGLEVGFVLESDTSMTPFMRVAHELFGDEFPRHHEEKLGDRR